MMMIKDDKNRHIPSTSTTSSGTDPDKVLDAAAFDFVSMTVSRPLHHARSTGGAAGADSATIDAVRTYNPPSCSKTASVQKSPPQERRHVRFSSECCVITTTDDDYDGSVATQSTTSNETDDSDYTTQRQRQRQRQSQHAAHDVPWKKKKRHPERFHYDKNCASSIWWFPKRFCVIFLLGVALATLVLVVAVKLSNVHRPEDVYYNVSQDKDLVVRNNDLERTLEVLVFGCIVVLLSGSLCYCYGSFVEQQQQQWDDNQEVKQGKRTSLTKQVQDQQSQSTPQEPV